MGSELVSGSNLLRDEIRGPELLYTIVQYLVQNFNSLLRYQNHKMDISWSHLIRQCWKVKALALGQNMTRGKFTCPQSCSILLGRTQLLCHCHSASTQREVYEHTIQKGNSTQVNNCSPNFRNDVLQWCLTQQTPPQIKIT